MDTHTPSAISKRSDLHIMNGAVATRIWHKELDPLDPGLRVDSEGVEIVGPCRHLFLSWAELDELRGMVSK